MTDRPMPFKALMVRALLDGRKSQTRWALNPQPRLFEIDKHGTPCQVGNMQVEGEAVNRLWLGSEQAGVLTNQEVCYVIGDRFWVQESWQLHSRATDFCTVAYKASVNHSGWSEAHEQFPDALAGNMRLQPFQNGWRHSIGMPRWASRLTLTVTDVRVERLQDISIADAIAEGCKHPLADTALGDFPESGPGTYIADERTTFARRWISINGLNAWRASPWVSAITFDVAQRNIDQ